MGIQGCDNWIQGRLDDIIIIQEYCTCQHLAKTFHANQDFFKH